MCRHMKNLKITTENATFQVIESLKRNREKRSKQKQFLVEGVRSINNAVEYGWSIEALIFPEHRKLSGWAMEKIDTSKAEVHYSVSEDILQKLSDKDESSELLALVNMREDDLSQIPVKRDLLVVVFDRPTSPGNLGSIIRSCDALSVDGLLITGHAADVYDPETVRASTGSLFSLPVIRKSSHQDLVPWIQEMKGQLPDLQIIGTDEDGSIDIFDADFQKPTILLAGNETSGLSAAYKELADTLVKIPMSGSASSLNVASATSIALYEVARQRRLKV